MTRLFIFAFSLVALSASAQDFNLVEELLLEEQLSAAKSEIQKILKDYPENASAYYWLGSVLAREYAEKDLNPEKDIKLMIDAGVSFEKAKFLNHACLQETDQGKQLKSFSSKVYNLGINSYQSGNIEMAFTHFKMVVMANEWVGKNDHEALYYTGHCANKLNSASSAKAYLEKAIVLKPEDLKVVRELIKAKMELGENDEARVLAKSALTYHPTDQSLWQDLMSISMKLQDDEEALSAAQTLSHLDSGNATTKAFLASLYDRTGNKEKAINTYLECVALDSEHAMANYNLGVLLYNEAITTLQMAPSPEAKAEATNKLQTAKFHLEQAYKLDPSNEEAKKILKNIEKMN